MDVNWEFQRENAWLQKENADLAKELAYYRVKEVSDGFPSHGKVFTHEQSEFIKAEKLNRQKVYRLVKKYESVEDAILEAMEEKINENYKR